MRGKEMPVATTAHAPHGLAIIRIRGHPTKDETPSAMVDRDIGSWL
ncbi:MAG: hypothetical protein J5627_00170 [Bacilli bacterium]|nr:hypothetical protein [Bacilli bacterium]